MSGGSAFGGARGIAAKAPEKGVFPLDHFGECKVVMKDYLACLKRESGDSIECKELSRRYLECRMDKNLMAREDLRKLGFKDKDASSSRSAPARPARARAREGFIPGVGRGQGE